MAHWFPFYVGDYLRDTMHLTTQEHGAYLLLIVCLWSAQTLPDDDLTLAQVARLPIEDWRRARTKLAPFFRIENGAWSHDRVDLEREKSSRRMDRAAAGGKAKAAQAMPKQTASKAQAMPGGCKSQSQSQSQGRGSLSGSASPPPDLQAAVDAYNDMAKRVGLPVCQRLSDTRRKALKARLTEIGGLEGWTAVMAKVEASKFLTGRGDKPFRADFDFITTASKFTRIAEGRYDDTKPQSSGRSAQEFIRTGGLDRMLAEFEQAERGPVESPGTPDWLAGDGPVEDRGGSSA